jgi:hypothetical protein
MVVAFCLSLRLLHQLSLITASVREPQALAPQILSGVGT